jgi:NAD(P)-dependent dehydrogenase (short-subunit alcohol dehydrogenase family)
MAQALGECGAKAIVIMDLFQEPGDAAAAELQEKCGVPVKFYKVDVRDEKRIAEVISHVTEAFGSIDVLINSAGVAE